jgi:hypothetical protein
VVRAGGGGDDGGRSCDPRLDQHGHRYAGEEGVESDFESLRVTLSCVTQDVPCLWVSRVLVAERAILKRGRKRSFTPEALAT